MADKKHPEYKEYAERCELEKWEVWDPKEFGLEEGQYLLNEMFSNS